MGKPTWEADYSAYFTARAVALRRLAYGLCGDWHLAEDLVQATFVKLYRHWNRAQADTLDAYVRKILVNTFLSHRRSRRHEQVMPDVPDRPARTGDVPALLDLSAALARLPRQQRAVLVLRYLEQLSVAETADALGVAEGTVKSQTARGLDALRVALGPRSEPLLVLTTKELT
jgi:RNA polymerase sigma-70 factor (sigma-E family)